MRKLHCLPVGVLLLIGEGLLAQTTMDVSGKITDPTGGPIPNATIRIKSAKSSSGTSADVNGGFTLRVNPGAEVIFSAEITNSDRVEVVQGAVFISLCGANLHLWLADANNDIINSISWSGKGAGRLCSSGRTSS